MSGTPRDPFRGTDGPRLIRPGIALLCSLLPPAEARLCAREAYRLGVSPLEYAVATRRLTEKEVVQAVAATLGGATADIGAPGWRFAAALTSVPDTLEAGSAVLIAPDGCRKLVFAPRIGDLDRLLAMAPRTGKHTRSLTLATREAFEVLVHREGQEAWTKAAVRSLLVEAPTHSAADRARMARWGFLLLALLACLTIVMVASSPQTCLLCGLILLVFCLGWSLFRGLAALHSPRAMPRLSLRDQDLPRYSIICPLYRETSVITQLVNAIASMDYPLVRLDVLFVVERDDPETRLALEALPIPFPHRIIEAPPEGPRTKPKALMLALPFARGSCVVVYDAEDIPHPGQLREAAETFAAGDLRLGCLQAPLAIDVTRDGRRPGWRDHLYRAEYAGLFRVMLPFLAARGWPIPLGGTSNHFRRACLRQSGGWDPYNVTEDADLGLRLSRNGWLIGALRLPTHEETPADWRGWFGQRSRWFKGWLQTGIVLLHDPPGLVREMGWRHAVLAMFILAGAALTPLVHALGLLGLAALAWHGVALSTILGWIVASAAVTALVAVVDAEGLDREGAPRHAAFWLVLTPAIHLALATAALAAILALVRHPYHWEKTAHGPKQAGRAKRAGVRSRPFSMIRLTAP